MRYDSTRHHRRSIRLPGFDYTSGIFFITICIDGRIHYLGHASSHTIRLTPAGEMVTAHWLALPERFPFLTCADFVVMPNHFHGILTLTGEIPQFTPSGEKPNGTREGSLGRVIQAFKSLTTGAYIRGVRQQNWETFERRFWQRNYYEHIVRNDRELSRIQRYIEQNPARWLHDRFCTDPKQVHRSI